VPTALDPRPSGVVGAHACAQAARIILRAGASPSSRPSFKSPNNMTRIPESRKNRQTGCVGGVQLVSLPASAGAWLWRTVRSYRGILFCTLHKHDCFHETGPSRSGRPYYIFTQWKVSRGKLERTRGWSWRTVSIPCPSWMILNRVLHQAISANRLEIVATGAISPLGNSI